MSDWRSLRSAGGEPHNEVPETWVELTGNLVEAIVNPILSVIFAAALVYFLWGLAMFIMHGSNSSKRAEYQQHMLWGVVGMTVMVSVYALIALVMATLGFSSSVEGLPV